MAFCPKCKSEYREGFTRCESCQVDLIDELPEEDEDKKGIINFEPEGTQFKKLFVAKNDIELSYVVSMLEAEEIEYRLSGTGKSIAYGDIYFFGKIIASKRCVYVDSSKIDEAREIVRSRMR